MDEGAVMAGPWESYQPAQTETGPWASYAQTGQFATPAPQQPVNSNGGPSFLAGLGRGLMDPLDAGAQAIANGASVLGLDKLANNVLGDKIAPTAEQLKQNIANETNQYEAQRQQSGQTGIDWARMAGNVPASVAIGAMVPSVGSGLVGAIGTGALQGAAAGALTPAIDPNKTFVDEKLDQLGQGAAFGAALGGAGDLFRKAIAPAIDPAVQRLRDAGVKLLPGQVVGGSIKRLEEGATSVPLMGDAIKSGLNEGQDSFVKAAWNKVLSGIGKKYDGDVTQHGFDGVWNQVADSENKLLPRLSLPVDQQLSADLQSIKTAAAQLPEQQKGVFDRFYNMFVEPKLQSGAVDGKSIKSLLSDVGKKVDNFATGGGSDGELGDVFKSLKSKLQENIARTNQDITTPEGANYGDIRKAWAQLYTLQDASAASAKTGATFTPGQLQSALKRSIGKNQFTRMKGGDLQQLANDAEQVIGSTVPDSGTPFRSAVELGLGALAGHGLGLEPAHMLGMGAGLAGGTAMYSPWGRQAMSSLAANGMIGAPISGASSLMGMIADNLSPGAKKQFLLASQKALSDAAKKTPQFLSPLVSGVMPAATVGITSGLLAPR